MPVRLLGRREEFTEPDFALWARAFNRAEYNGISAGGSVSQRTF